MYNIETVVDPDQIESIWKRNGYTMLANAASTLFSTLDLASYLQLVAN
jgi:hypothetical protein